MALRLSEGLGVAGELDARFMLSVRAPEGDHFQVFAPHPVVDVVADSFEQPASSFGRLGVLDFRSNSREVDEQLQRLLQIMGYGAWCCWAVIAPPCGSLVDFSPCARFDPCSESQDQLYLRSSAKSSSAEIPSSRSASSSACSSSCCRAGGSRTVPS